MKNKTNQAKGKSMDEIFAFEATHSVGALNRSWAKKAQNHPKKSSGEGSSKLSSPRPKSYKKR